jgi:hypothetical protein
MTDQPMPESESDVLPMEHVPDYGGRVPGVVEPMAAKDPSQETVVIPAGPSEPAPANPVVEEVVTPSAEIEAADVAVAETTSQEVEPA